MLNRLYTNLTELKLIESLNTHECSLWLWNGGNSIGKEYHVNQTTSKIITSWTGAEARNYLNTAFIVCLILWVIRASLPTRNMKIKSSSQEYLRNLMEDKAIHVNEAFKLTEVLCVWRSRLTCSQDTFETYQVDAACPPEVAMLNSSILIWPFFLLLPQLNSFYPPKRLTSKDKRRSLMKAQTTSLKPSALMMRRKNKIYDQTRSPRAIHPW